MLSIYLKESSKLRVDRKYFIEAPCTDFSLLIPYLSLINNQYWFKMLPTSQQKTPH